MPRLLAASLFHLGILTVPQVKDHLAAQGLPVRR
jgi:imidazole glycerol phosphate synthase subunit HisF